jgi:glycerol-3-phosphate acyltransferase PlsY
MEYIISAIIGYLAGSVPSAYIVMKKTRGIDITSAGSGNVGAMNTLEVSNSKLTGALVLMLDALKGLLSVYIPLLLFPVNFIYPALGLLFAVFSHCYNPWIGFKGGRGLATCAGGSFLLFPFLPAAWIVLWIIIYIIKKDILFANIAATILSLVTVFGVSDYAVGYTYPRADTIASALFFSSGILLIVFIRHIEPLKEILHKSDVIKPEVKDGK